MRLKGYILGQFTKVTEDHIWFPGCHKTPKAQAKCKLSTKPSAEPSWPHMGGQQGFSFCKGAGASNSTGLLKVSFQGGLQRREIQISKSQEGRLAKSKFKDICPSAAIGGSAVFPPNPSTAVLAPWWDGNRENQLQGA